LLSPVEELTEEVGELSVPSLDSVATLDLAPWPLTAEGHPIAGVRGAGKKRTYDGSCSSNSGTLAAVAVLLLGSSACGLNGPSFCRSVVVALQ